VEGRKNYLGEKNFSRSRSISDSSGESFATATVSRAVSHPRAIPGSGKSDNVSSASFRYSRHCRERRNRGGDQTESNLFEDACSEFRLGPEARVSQPKSVPVSGTGGRLPYYQSTASGAILKDKRKTSSGVDDSKPIQSSVKAPETYFDAGNTTITKFRPSSLVVTAREKRNAGARHRISSSLRGRLLMTGSPSSFVSSSFTETGGVKTVTLPSGEMYKSRSNNSLVDMISRSSFTSQQHGSGATTNSRYLLLMSGDESVSTAGNESWSNSAYRNTSLPFAFGSNNDFTSLSPTSPGSEGSAVAMARRGSSLSSTSSTQQRYVQRLNSAMNSTSCSNSPLFPTGFTDTIHNDPLLKGPLHHPQQTLAGSSLPREPSTFRSHSLPKTFPSNLRERAPSTTSSGADISKISISPFRTSSRSNHEAAPRDSVPRKTSIDMFEFRRSRSSSIPTVPTVMPWVVSEQDVQNMYAKFLEEAEGIRSSTSVEAYVSNETVDGDTEDENDMPFAFQISDSKEDLQRNKNGDNELILFLRKMRQVPSLPSLGIEKG